MIFKHRQNNIIEQIVIGVEVDVRSHPAGLVLNHDRLDFSKSYPLLKDKISFFNGPIIFNIKESGIEEEILKKINKEFYFLDSQLPDIIRLGPKNLGKFIVRVSDVESFNQSLIELIKPKYCWVDYSKFNINYNHKEYIDYIKTMIAAAKYHKIEPILVSPDLYTLNNAHLAEKIAIDIQINNVCSKIPEIWEK
jgi:hypothetical protein